MKNPTKINLFGAPSSGKSTIAYSLCGYLRQRGYNSEICREWIKDWAYQQKVPNEVEQILVFANQINLENILLFNKVEYIICECPLLFNCFYAKGMFHHDEILGIAKKFQENFNNINIFLEFDERLYKQCGRYHGLEQCKRLNDEIKYYLNDNNISYITNKCSNLLKGENLCLIKSLIV